MTNWIATPVDDGFGAYELGAQECECPHPPNTPEAIMWKKGWRRARDRSLDTGPSFGLAKHLDAPKPI